MRKGLVYPIISAVITAFIGSLITYFILTPGSGPLAGVYVEYKPISVKPPLFFHFFTKVLNQKVDDRETLEKFASELGSSNDYYLQKFTIHNDTTKVVSDVEVRVAGLFSLAYFSDETGFHIIKDNDGTTKQLTIGPRKTAELVVVAVTPYFLSLRRYGTVEDITITQGKYELPIYEFDITGAMLPTKIVQIMFDYPVVLFPLFLGAALFWVLLIVGVVIVFLNKNSAYFLIKNTSDTAVANSLVAYQYIRAEDSARADKIVREAEKFHAKLEARKAE